MDLSLIISILGIVLAEPINLGVEAIKNHKNILRRWKDTLEVAISKTFKAYNIDVSKQSISNFSLKLSDLIKNKIPDNIDEVNEYIKISIEDAEIKCCISSIQFNIVKFSESFFVNWNELIINNHELSEFLNLIYSRNTSQVIKEVRKSINCLSENQKETTEISKKIFYAIDNKKISAPKYNDSNVLNEYREKYSQLLFLENNEITQIRLGDIFVTPSYTTKSLTFNDAFEGIVNFIENKPSNKFTGINSLNKALIILGMPGIGKSTLIAKIASRIQSKELVIFRCKDLDYNTMIFSIEDAIVKQLNQNRSYFKGKIIILEGYDEALLINNEKLDQSTNLRKFIDYINTKVIITCRKNYIMEDESYFINTQIIELIPFDRNKINSYIERYEELSRTKVVSREGYYSDIKLFGIPLILYIALRLKMDITSITERTSFFDDVFSVNGKILMRLYNPGEAYDGVTLTRDTQKRIQLHKIIIKIARKMFMTGERHLNTEQLYSITNSENYDEDVKRYYAISFYYSKTECGAIEFIHNSIYDYFVAQNFFIMIADMYNPIFNVEIVFKQWAEFFSTKEITREILDFTLSSIIKNGYIEREIYESKLKQLFQFMLDTCGINEYIRNSNSKYMDKATILTNSIWETTIAVYKKIAQEDRDVFSITKIVGNKQRELVELIHIISGSRELTGCIFNNNNFHLCDFRLTNLYNASLSNLTISDCDFSFGKIANSYFDKVNITSTSFSGTIFNECKFKHCTFDGIDFIETAFLNCKFSNSDFSRCIIHEKYLVGLTGRNNVIDKAFISHGDLITIYTEYIKSSSI